MKKKNNNIKIYLQKFKELWSIPRYRALIKLSLYAIMFTILIVMANLYNNLKTENQSNDKEKSYAEILSSTELENVDITYNIKINNIEYSIEGKINNGILTGYLESNSIIKKIKIKDYLIYNVVNDIEQLDEELNNLIITEFLFPKNIVELINNESAYINKQDDSTFYVYEKNYNGVDYEVKLVSNLQYFTNLIIKNNNVEYNLNINFDKTL